MTKVEVTLVPPKDGKLKIKAGDRIWWMHGIPYRLEVKVQSSARRVKT